MAGDGDLHGRVQPHGDVVRAVGVLDAHLPAGQLGGGAVQELVDLAQRLLGQIEAQAFHTYISSGAGSNTVACWMSGRWASERNSLAMAT